MRSDVHSISFISGLVLLVLNTGPLVAAHFKESFETDPFDRGWRVEGQHELFAWQESTQSLATIWDSSQPNSFYYLPLPRELTEREDFGFSFDLELQEVQVGVSATKPSTFEIALGFFRRADAFAEGYIRGTGRHTPNLVEWNYFPEAVPITPTVTMAITSPQQQFLTDGFVNQLELVTGVVYHVNAQYVAGTRTLTMQMTVHGEPFGRPSYVVLPRGFAGFTFDAFGVSSYSDEGQFSPYGGSIYAQGKLDNLELRFEPTPPRLEVVSEASGSLQLSFNAEPGELYVIESSADLEKWEPVTMIITDRLQAVSWNPNLGSTANQFYRLGIQSQ